MSIRQKILAALNTGPKTMDEMQDALPDEPRKRIQDNITATIKDGLATRAMDDVTRLPLYKINEKGKQRLAQGPGNLAQNIRKPKTAENISISGKDADQVSSESLRKENLRLIDKVHRLEVEHTGLRNHVELILSALSVTTIGEALNTIELLHSIEQERARIKAGATMTEQVIKPEFNGYACIVGARIHDNERDAILEAEAALVDLVAGQCVHVAGILHTAQNVVVCQWKKAA
ncbi:MAG: hypothetical protein K8H84_07255 [Sulfuricella denitrificans]|nr:hypothetical protein [Sulfuricella denitrificans]